MLKTLIADTSERKAAPEEYYRTEAAARYFGVSRRILLSWEKLGLPFYRPNSRVTLVKLEDVRAFLSQSRSPKKSGGVA